MQHSTIKKLHNSQWDTVGIAASLLCAVHCVLLPVFFAALPFLGSNLLKNPFIEMATVCISFFAGGLAFYNGYKKVHKKWLPLLFATGFFTLVASNLVETSRDVEIILKIAAAVMIVTAHIFNIRLRRHCDWCEDNSVINDKIISIE